ncbi:MAG TPA: twin-arginine translocase subunit TatC [Rhodobacteraceae bacterium]|nr:twin-arginine translocase subunit TatC [Paracoccaceae bacterium]
MSDSEVESSAAPLIEHLAELRNRLIRSVLAFVVGMLICYSVSQQIFDFLASPICTQLIEATGECGLIFTGLQKGFTTALRISMFGGFILAFPVIGWQLWQFVAPGLYKKEKGAFLPFLLASPVLFFIGASFAFYAVLPLAFDFFLGYQNLGSEGAEALDGPAEVGITFLGTIDEYLGLTMKFVLAFGLTFQLPVLMTLLAKAGMLNAKALTSTRKYAIVAILGLAAVITPPDVVTQIIMFTVIYGLYELSIILVKIVDKKREAQLKADGFYDDDDAEPEVKAKAEAPILEIVEDEDDDFEANAFDDDNKPT